MALLLGGLMLVTAPKKDQAKCEAWGAREHRGLFNPETIGVRCTIPPPRGLECPAIVWEVWAGSPHDSEARLVNSATWEPDCNDATEWEPPAARTYGIGEGSWTFRVWFCGAGLDGKDCKRGGVTKYSDVPVQR